MREGTSHDMPEGESSRGITGVRAMFGRSGNGGASTTTGGNGARRPGGFSIIGTDVVITGNIQAQSDLHVEGRIEGDLDCGNLVQGADSVIRGAVRATTARIAGTIEGAVAVRQLTVEAGARILGDVEYDTIALETGAQIDGRLKHMSGQPATPALAAPPALTVADAAE